MTEDQLATIIRLFVEMPYLGGRFTPIPADNPIPAIIRNLEALKEQLDYAVESGFEKDRVIDQHRQLVRSAHMIWTIMRED